MGKSVSSANHIQRALSSTSQRSPSSTHKTLMCAVVQRRLPLLSLSLSRPPQLSHSRCPPRLVVEQQYRESERERDSDREREAKQRSPLHGLDTATSSKAQRVRAGSCPSVQSVFRAVHVHHGCITENFVCMTTYPVSRCRVMRATSIRSQTCRMAASSRTKVGRERRGKK